ncbi:alpha-tocopherol transfer protein-like [Trichonephila inaurata madagascariensis]|uniref:Alpha-tocopherol transfer protein-like n=1 Tax=Trichonephila inaurata madagascariensis TaxID=2747483 RepID=A0A8X6XKZ2_9ARAC|nr:alpha-tocopherol transfer protein-like [Trichonephila inaurata madagascariensis]
MATKYEERMKAKGFLSYHLDTLPAKFIQKAKEELGETDEIRQSALEQFRKRILEKVRDLLNLKSCSYATQLIEIATVTLITIPEYLWQQTLCMHGWSYDNMLKYPTDDEFLIQFLRARKYDVDKAMGLLNNYLNLITSHPDFLNNVDKEKMDKLTSDLFNVLPYRDNDGCLVVIFKIENWDSDDINEQVLFCTIGAILFCLSIHPANQICGIRLIYDAKNYSFKQMRCFVPKYLPLVAKALRNSLPIRFKDIHVVNEGIVFHCVWTFLSLLLSVKIRNRFYIHGNNTGKLQKHIPKEIIPREYGGDLINYNDDDWLKKEVDKFYDRFLMMVKSYFEKNCT